MYNPVFLESLTDDEIKYMYSDPSFTDLLLDPIKKAPRGTHYKIYDRYLGTKDKKSNMVKMYLPGIALELYKDLDSNYVRITQRIAEKLATSLQEAFEDVYGNEYSDEQLQQFSNDDFVEFLVKFAELPDRALDLNVFWIQLKLNGIFLEDERREDIRSLWEMLNGIDLLHEDNNLDESITESEDEQTSIEEGLDKKKKITKSAKKGLTAAEKEAKRKALEAQKKKEEKEKQHEQIEESHTENVTGISKNDEQGTQEISSEESHNTSDYEGKKMHAYVGTVNVMNSVGMNFYNFNPIGELNGKVFTPFMEHELTERFPESAFRNILLYYSGAAEQVRFVSSKLWDGMLLILEYEVDEMEINYSSTTGEINNTGYKVKVVDGFRSGKIRYLWEDGFYAVRSKDILRDEIGQRNYAKIEGDNLIEGEKFFIEYEKNCYVGPFKASYKGTLDSFVIETGAGSNKYLVDGYQSSKLKMTCFERIFSVGPLNYMRTYLYSIPSACEPEKIDVISDKALLEAFSEDVKRLGRESIDVTELPKYINESKDSSFAGEGITDEIAKARYDRLEYLLSNTVGDEASYDSVLDVICNVLINSKDNDRVNELFRELFKRDNFAENIQSVKYLREQIEALRDERNSLQENKNELQIQQGRDNRKQKEEELISGEHQRLKDELENLNKQIAEKQEIAAKYDSFEKLEENVAYLEKHKEILSKDVKDLELSFTQMINNSSSKMADITFDGFVSSKMMEAASRWEEDEKAKSHEALIDYMNNGDLSDLTGDDLVDYLVKLVQMERPHYNKNMVINLLICSMQGMLTVFAGPPGCGKTSICNIIARVLGTNSFEMTDIGGTQIKPNRFIQVSVERGWTSKRDFIGYYNPLTKTFEENNREVFDGLKILNTEARKGIHKLPFMILLDEANLSPMEYYWADFMNVCDDLENNHSINLGNDNVFEIPDTLHFVATINNDHTTETLSPRLIDRAWVVTLPQEKLYIPGKDIPDSEIKKVSWKGLRDTFVDYDEDIEFSKDVQVIYDEIKMILGDMGLSISIRTDKAIKRYYSVAATLMEEDKEAGYSAEIIALDYAISQKILPRISGSGQEYEDWLTKFRDVAKKNYLINTSVILNRIIESGKRQMSYYQFFN